MTPRVPFAERGGALRGMLDLATGCYPAFLFGGSTAGVLPVFHFHEVTRDWLEPRLQFLSENGYRTVDCDQIARFAIEGIDPGPRAVGLTFDDAWASAWTVVGPVLKQFAMRAILFVIPGRIGGDSGARFATWEQLRILHETGLFDIQSHTRSHAMIFSADEIIDFVTPGYAREPILERPLASPDVSSDQVRFIEPDALGTPLYQRRSRMSDARRFLADEAAAERCRRYVAEHGGRAFFDVPGWREKLLAVAASVSSRAGVFESEEAASTAIHEELAAGRALLNQRLGTTTVRHVALPWGISGERTWRTLAATGHDTAFAERPFLRRGVHHGDDRYQLMRLNGKFVTCLPGRGRQWFFTTVGRG